jgi:serine/threonine protein kinase
MEVNAVIKITKSGHHENIVTIFSHGSLPDSNYYYIDMELCDFNLEDYICGRRSLSLEYHAESIIHMQKRSDMINTDPLSKNQAAWTAMVHMNEGLCFLHDRHFVHRDLKPRNGTTSMFYNVSKFAQSFIPGVTISGN